MLVSGPDIRGLIQNTNVNVDISKLQDDTSFQQLDLDSLDLASVFLAIEEKCGIKIPDDAFDSLDTLNDVVTYMKDK